jgi:alpha amylase-like protein
MINDLWYKNAIIYCLAVSTYMDANGDGIGDFPGLMNRLDYLQGIGVTAIWLMPFQPSPFRDDGYDVADYYGVDPRYGTLGDFVEFTHGCRQRGIRVLIDLVVNHTSDKHPWFKKHAPIQDPSIGIGMSGRRRNRNMRTRELSFLVCRNPLGTMTSSPGPGTSIDFMTSSLT